MLTILTIEDKLCKGAGSKLLREVVPDTLKVREYGEKFQIRHIEYINRKGKINWKKIGKKAGQGRTSLLYSSEHKVPSDCGIKLFEPISLRQRLCTNMALSVLELMKDVPKALRIGLYDPEGEHSDLPEHLLAYSNNLVVVTKNYEVYRQQAQRLLDETGAVLCVSPHISLLSTCGLIVSPTLLDRSFTPKFQSVILTCHKPTVSLACRVYYMYSFRLSPELESLKPEGLSAELFAGALYSLYGVYTLGSLVPLVCTGENDSQTTLSLRRYLCDSFGT